MRIASGSAFFFSLAVSACAAPAAITSTQSDLPTTASYISGYPTASDPVNPNGFGKSKVISLSDWNWADRSAPIASSMATDTALYDGPSAVAVAGRILKPVEHIPCGLGVSPPHHLPPGYQVDCPELNSRILGASEPSSGITHAPRGFPTPTQVPAIDRSSYPPTEPSSFYELDPTMLPPDPTTTYPQIIPVISATTVPGGPTLTNFIGHLSIVLDNPPPTSTVLPDNN